MAEEFVQYLDNGEGLDEGNPCLMLRNRLIKEMMTPHSNLRLEYKVAMAINTFNYMVRGQAMPKAALKWDASKGDFPAVAGLVLHVNPETDAAESKS